MSLPTRSTATFDPYGVELSGPHLVEASAGTGKTHAIGSLVLRLLVERGPGGTEPLTIDRLLVVTFTNAATAELRDRLRRRLTAAIAAIDDGATPDDASGEAEFALWLRRVSDRDVPAARARLERALRDFDDAAVFTIHGFCQRMLHEFAFESRVDFGVDLVGDQSALIDTAITDFWARLAYDAPPTPVAWLTTAGGIRPASLQAIGRALVRSAHLELVPPRTGASSAPPDLVAIQRRYDAEVAIMVEAWRAGGPQAIEMVAGAAEERVLNGTRYKAPTIRGAWRSSLEAFLARVPPWPDGVAGTAIARMADVPNSANKGRTAPHHPFVEACVDLQATLVALQAEMESWALAVRHDLADWLAAELPERKRRARQQSFDDLLRRLHAALHGDSVAAARLAARVRGRFRAALIDEFQDTDRVQYEIFRAVFAPAALGGVRSGDDDAAQDRPLLLVGDPKQAIYAFRGADVFAYLDAVALVGDERRHTLGVNFRSDRSLVGALEALWTGVPRPFLFEGISFEPVRAQHDDRVDPPEPPLRFAYIPAGVADRESVGGPAHVEWARRAAARAAARSIACLLADPPLVPSDGGGQKPLRAEDVAVLVRTNREASRMQRALRDRGIPSVLSSEASVLDQPEAPELRRLLAAVLDPADAGALRSALVTAPVGLDGERLLALAEDEAAWDDWVERFRDWQRVWRAAGLLPAVRRMLDACGSTAALLALPDGERRLTNLTHLAELLHGAAFELALGPEALIGWFDRMLSDPDQRDRDLGDTGQLRLESDASAVQVLTVHKSKGLQFRFVYCPFLWGGGKRKAGVVLPFHDLDGDRHARLDVDPTTDGPSARAARLEGLSEDLRLLYVALTRARHRCWVAWGPFNEVCDGALAYVLTAHRASAIVPIGDDPGELDVWRAAVSRAAKDDIARAAETDVPQDDPLWMSLSRLAEEHPALIAAERLTVADVRRAGTEVSFDRAAMPTPVPDRGIGPPGPRRLEHVPERQLMRSSFTALSRGEREVFVADSADGVDRDAVTGSGSADGADRDGVNGDGLLQDGAVRLGADAAGPSTGGDAGRVPLADLRGGVRLGTGLHVLMEGLDYDRPERWMARARALAERRLLPAEAVEPLADALGSILGTPLGEGELGFRLRDVARADRLDEMGYVLPVALEADGGRFAARRGDGAAGGAEMSVGRPVARRVGPRDLARVLASHPGGAMPPDYPARLAGLPASAFAGWLSGALDLVFRRCGDGGERRWFLLDWKSNRLGATWSDYAPERLIAAMVRHHYFLQAHLYALALHRHLRLRQDGYAYDRHFGGVLYLFVRGMRPEVVGSGVVFDRPPEARMAALDDLLFEGSP